MVFLIHPIVGIIDITPILDCSELENLHLNTTSLITESNACNSNNITMFNLTDYESIVLIDIGDDNLMYVNRFVIDGLNHLNTLKIGMNSFGSYDEESIFQILNCNELESIEIDYGSFSDYGGLFELKNLPKLSTIKIGEIGIDSSNFCYSLFEIEVC